MSDTTKKLNNKTKVLIALFFIVVIALSLYIYLVPEISDIFKDKYTAEYGTLSVGTDTEYLVIRKEKVYFSDRDGSVKRLSNQGDIERSYTSIVTVGSEKFTAKERGVVSFFYDGYEEKFTPDLMDNLKVSAIRMAKGTEEHPYKLSECSKENVEAGDVIFKTVDNQEWYILVWLDKEYASQYSVGKKITVELEDGTQLQTKVHSINEQGTSLEIILSCNRYYVDFDKLRIGTAKLITTQKSGIILETSSIVTVDEQKGVYVINKLGESIFTPIKVLAEVGDKTVVEKNYYYDSEGNYRATVKIYDTILRIDSSESSEAKKDVN